MRTETELSDQMASKMSLRVTAMSLLPLLLISLIVWSCDSLPFLDLPNHLTRAYIIGHHGEPEFARDFYYEPRFVPYILGDLMLAQLLRLLPPSIAGRVWMISLYLAFAVAVWSLARARGSRASGPTLFLVISYLGTNYFYVSGFHSFLLSIVLVLLAVAAWERWLVHRGTAQFASFAALAVLAYLSHLAGLFFLGTWIGAVAVVRLLFARLRPGTLLLSVLPLIALLTWHSLNRQLGTNVTDGFAFRSLPMKLVSLGGMFIRYSYPLELPLGLLCVGLLISLIASTRGFAIPQQLERYHEWLFLGLVFTGTFFVLPHQVGPATSVDLRALPYMAICLLMFALESTPERTRNGRKAMCAASLLALSNCALLFHFWRSMDLRLTGLQTAVQAVPPGKQLLSVVTWDQLGRMAYGLHHGELYMVYSKGGISPDVFANSNAPNQFPYFTYRTPSYSPGPFWYVRELDATVQWDRIAVSYQYMLITKPYDPARIKLVPIRTIFENDSAAVLQLRD